LPNDETGDLYSHFSIWQDWPIDIELSIEEFDYWVQDHPAFCTIVASIAFGPITYGVSRTLSVLVEPVGDIIVWIRNAGPWSAQWAVVLSLMALFAGFRLIAVPLHLLIRILLYKPAVAHLFALARSLVEGILLFLVVQALEASKLGWLEQTPWLLAANWPLWEKAILSAVLVAASFLVGWFVLSVLAEPACAHHMIQALAQLRHGVAELPVFLGF
jgi:hypothetical protein